MTALFYWHSATSHSVDIDGLCQFGLKSLVMQIRCRPKKTKNLRCCIILGRKHFENLLHIFRCFISSGPNEKRCLQYSEIILYQGI